MSVTARLSEGIIQEVEKVFKGKRRQLEVAVAAYLVGGHVLIEDRPGLGKTVMARALARAVGGSFKRIQFTSDMLPSDILGIQVYDERSHSFVFHRGPIFANVVLADEINRANPRTQSAMLEAMTEGKISIENETYSLPSPFFVVATQNPIELHGAYPLPESELDRFLVRLEFGYPAQDTEVSILQAGGFETAVEQAVGTVGTKEELDASRKEQERVTISRELLEYIVALGRATREERGLDLGVSTRGLIGLAKLAKVKALIEGRDYCIPDDIVHFVPYVFVHRVRLKGFGFSDPARRSETLAIIKEILARTPVPV